MNKKLISCILSASMLCTSIGILPVKAEQTPYFTHQNVVGSQTCYGDDTAEKTIDEIPNVIQGMRINQPVFRTKGLSPNTSYTVNQLLKDGTVLKTENVVADENGTIEFKHIRNCEEVEVLNGKTVVASLNAELEYKNGVAITSAPMSYQIYQRDENNKAEIKIKGKTENETSVSVDINGTEESVTVSGNEFEYTKTLDTGLYDITVTSNKGEVAKYEKVGVGDVWVAAGQSNVTDMGAVTDDFSPEDDDPINENMHIIYAEDCTWQQMSHPAGEGRFFKTGVRTSPVTSFAREISEKENVPIGIVQTSVGGTNIWQWIDGIRNDANSGYLFNALKSCFDKMPSKNIKGILWYQGCNDAINENYAYDYKNLQQKVFDTMRDFFDENTPIITTQLNDANQDSNSSQGYYDAWSYVKDIQRQNESLYDNVYVVGTGELELGDTIHNNAASNVKLGAKWAKVAEAVVYGDESVSYENAQIDTAKVTGDNEITLTFKNTDGLKVATGTKRIGITNVSGGGYKIPLGDLTKEFTVRKGASRKVTASNKDKGTEMTIKSAEIQADKKSVVITTEEDLAGVIAVDCMYGKRFTPTLVDEKTNESVLSFYNVIAEYENKIPVTESFEINAKDSADLNNVTKTASDSTMYVNSWKSGNTDNTSYGLVKFDLENYDFSKIVSAKLAVYGNNIGKDRSGNITISDIGTDWDNTAVYGNVSYTPTVEITKINSNTASVFPVGNYSEIDITDYLRKYSKNEIGIGIASDYASDVTLSGKNSENPPKLIIQPGKMVTLSYTCNGEHCADMEVTIEAVGATEYQTTKHTTDKDGNVVVYLAEGSYKATTEKEIGVRNATSNTFTVSTDDLSNTYTVEKNNEEKPKPVENPTYTFGNKFNQIKTFNTSSLSETKIADTGLSISTNGSNYNNVAIMDSSSKTGTGYYPLGTGLKDNGYYLFMGTGGNSNTSMTLKFDNPIESGKYVKITYAKPTSTNDGSKNRSAGNANTMTIDGETIDIQSNCEFDKWYTTTVKLSNQTSQIDFNFGKWSSVAISKIEVSDDGDTFEITSDTTEKYITSETQIVQYSAKAYKSITTEMNGVDIVSKGSEDTTANITYSVNRYNGVSIDNTGSLSITPSASAGTVTVSAECNGIKKSINLVLKSLGNANAVEIYGDEVVNGQTAKYIAIPIADGVVIPARDTKWEIVNSVEGVSISDDGTLTVSDNATNGIVKIKATLIKSSVQTSEVANEFNVTIRKNNSEKSPYEVKGLLLKNGETNIENASGIDGIIVDKTGDSKNDYIAVVKVFDENKKLIIEHDIAIGELTDGVQKIDTDIAFKKASFAKVYIAKSDNDYTPSDNEYDIVKVTKLNDKLNTATVMQNKSKTETSATLIITQYKDGVLKQINDKKVKLQKGTNKINLSDIEVIDGADIKIFLWSDNMTPLATALTKISENEDYKIGEVVSDEIFSTTTGEYSNIPLVSDWLTGAKSGLGMGAGVISPSSVPYGIDPNLVDVSTLNVNYTYDNNYQGATADNALWYKTGAFLASANGANNSIYARDGADWEQQALPIGNGYMGGMIFGLPDKDQIQINEETFWAAGYRGTQTEVNSNTVNSKMSEGINGYMSVGNIFVDFNMPKGATVNNYYRDLNLDESVAHVRYEYDNKNFNREYFASYPKEVLVFRYTGDDLNFDVKPVSMHPGNVTVNNGEIKIVGKLKDSEPYSSGGNAAWNQESDLEYCTIIKVIADDGTVTGGYNSVNVSDSTGVTILVAVATDYDPTQFELNADGTVNMSKTPYKNTQGVKAAVEKAEKRIQGASELSYDELKNEHIKDYKEQFDKVQFSLTDNNEICSVPTNELQLSYKNTVTTKSVDNKTVVSYDESAYANLNKHLEELHYNYARYLMISSSRSTTMPSTLQGKWCQSTAEIWGSCYCININMEMNYWFAGGANLLDSGKSLIGWFNSQIPAGRITAKNMYKVTPKSYTLENGKMTFADSTDDKDDVFIMHTKQAIMGTTDMTGSTNIQSAGNTAWLMYNLWDLYQTSGDKQLLADELYPIMRKAANFYTQYLYQNQRRTTTDTEKYPNGYYYTTWEGRSPEQGPTEEGIKYDLQLIAGMYDYTIKAAEILGVDTDKVSAWKEIRNHLEIPVEIGGDGQIKEWKEETSYNTDANGKTLGDPVHRHISHLVGLYPGTLINRDTPELLNGAKVVLENRGDDSTGWSCSNKFLLWARCLDGDKALELFRYQLAQKHMLICLIHTHRFK